MKSLLKAASLIAILMMLFYGCTNSEKDKIEYLNKRYTSIDVTKEERVSMRMLTLLIDGFEKQDVILLKSVSAAHQDKSYGDIKKLLIKLKSLTPEIINCIMWRF
jgi:hypothetical protein